MLGNIVYTPAPAAAVATSLTIGTTPIVGGTAGAVLFESTLNKVSENAGLNYTAGGVLTITSITQQLKVAYNAGNKLDLTVGITGNATFSLTGTNPTFEFQKTTRFTGALGVQYTNGVDPQIWETSVSNAGNGNAFYIVDRSINVAIAQFSRGSSGNNFGVGAVPQARIHAVKTTEQLRLGYDNTNFASFTINSTGALTITLTGTALSTFFTNKVVLGNTITLAPYTFATLPAAPLAGQKAYIIDALAPVYLAPAVGGGLIFCPVFYNGVNWVTC